MNYSQVAKMVQAYGLHHPYVDTSKVKHLDGLVIEPIKYRGSKRTNRA